MLATLEPPPDTLTENDAFTHSADGNSLFMVWKTHSNCPLPLAYAVNWTTLDG
jgi:hypothetical protein